MTEYICRQAILDDLEKEIEAGNVALDEDVWINKGLRIAIRDIKDLKAADVQPVKHGTWQKVSELSWNNYKCSICNTQYVGMGAITFIYCPNCGTRMDGDAE